MGDLSLTALRVLRAIAEDGAFSAAADRLGYTQSAVSRQVAALERQLGVELVERLPRGARMTAAGMTLLRHARVALDELAAAERDLAGGPVARQRVRLGVYVSAGATVLPEVLPRLRRDHPSIDVTTREGTTPSLLRAVRAGTLDLAVVTSRPPHHAPDDELPRLVVETLGETELLVAVATDGRFAGQDSVTPDDLLDVDWIASSSGGADPLLGVWPNLPGRPNIVHSARDWLTKLQLVAAGAGVTTVPGLLRPVLPPGVRTVRVEGGQGERRRMRLVRLPGPAPAAVRVVAEALRASRSG